MPSQHRYPAITPRPHPDLKRRAQEAVATIGTDLNAYVIASLEYLVGDRNELPAKLPMSADSNATPAQSPNFRAAWAELVGYVRQSVTWRQQMDTSQLFGYLQELHTRNNLPPEQAPQRTEATDSER